MSIPFTPNGETRRLSLQYLIANPQLLALKQSRAGGLHLELRVRGFLPQASGFSGGPEATEHISIAESPMALR